MNQEMNDWLKQKANLPVSLAAGVVHADQSVFSHFYSRSFATILKENVWPALADMARVMGDQPLPTSHLRWLFQNAFVYTSTRSDGACAVIITSRNLSPEDAVTLESVLKEFQGL